MTGPDARRAKGAGAPKPPKSVPVRATPPADGPSTREVGASGEDRAVRFLLGLGYRILMRNYRCRHGEIDVVAFEGGEYVFVEVKLRASDDKGSALDAVTRAKQKKLARVAQQYLAERRIEDRPCRFDVVALGAGPGEDDVVRGAFHL